MIALNWTAKGQNCISPNCIYRNKLLPLEMLSDRKKTAFRRIASLGIHVCPIEDAPWTPRTITALSYRGLNGGPQLGSHYAERRRTLGQLCIWSLLFFPVRRSSAKWSALCLIRGCMDWTLLRNWLKWCCVICLEGFVAICVWIETNNDSIVDI